MRPSRSEIEFGELLNHTGYHIRRAHSTFMRLFAVHGREFALRSQQASILVLTRENPGITPATIADAIEIERSLMTRLLADLKSRGFVETRASISDGRQIGLYITPEGRKFARAIMSTFWNKLEPELSGNLTAAERKSLIRLLRKLYSPSR